MTKHNLKDVFQKNGLTMMKQIGTILALTVFMLGATSTKLLADSISGTTAVCAGTNYTYSLSQGGLNIVWTATGGTIVGSNSGVNVVVNWDSSSGSKQVAVTYKEFNLNGTPGNSVSLNESVYLYKGGSVSGGTTVCSGGSGTVSLSGQNGSILKWQKRTYSGGSWSGWSNISHTSTSYNYSNVTVKTQFRAVVNACGNLPSSATTVNVHAASDGGSISGAPTLSCHTASTTLTLANHVGSVVRWEKSTDYLLDLDGSVLSGTWTNITNLTTTLAISNVTQSTLYRARVNNNSCGSVYSDTEEVIVLSPNASVAGTISGGTASCGTATGTLSLSGQVGGVQKWQQRIDGGSWADLTNSYNQNTWDFDLSAIGVYEYRVQVNNGQCTTNEWSSAAAVEIREAAVGGVANTSMGDLIPEQTNNGPNVSACEGTTGSLYLTGSTGTVLRWEYREFISGAWTSWATHVGTSIAPNHDSEYRAYLQADVNCQAKWSTVASVTLDEPTVRGTLSGGNTFCDSGSGTLNLSGQLGSIKKWEKYDATSGWTDIANTTSSQTYTNLLEDTDYRVEVKNGKCDALLTALERVNVIQTNPGYISGANDAVDNLQATLDLEGYIGDSFVWQKETSPGTWVNDGGSTASHTVHLTESTKLRVQVQSGSCTPQYSAVKSITIHDKPVILMTELPIMSLGETRTLYLNDKYQSYQWVKDGKYITGANDTTLIADAFGSYQVQIVTISGNLTSTSSAVVLADAISFQFQNYVRTIRTTTAGILEDTDFNGVTQEELRENINYFDGLGRPLQQVVKAGSPGKYDIVGHHTYDAFGRRANSYLAYPDLPGVTGGSSDGKFKTNASADAVSVYNNLLGDSYPFSENTYESAPLSRMQTTHAPGQAWTKSDGNKPVNFSYGTNALNEVLQWEVVDGQAAKLNYYAAGRLNKTRTQDENGHWVEEFKNLQGQVLLKKVQVSAAAPTSDSDWLQTYYVYDDFSNLRFVLPPMAIENYVANGQELTSGAPLATADANFEAVAGSDQKVAFLPPASITVNEGTTLNEGADIFSVTSAATDFVLNDAFLEKWAFQYQYDERQRMIMKQVPGADSVLMVYDERDRLVMTQDGNQRAAGQWSFTKYDQFNRPVLTGLLAETKTRTQLQAEVELLTGAGFYETYTGTGSLMGYDGTGYPAGADADDLLTVTYYDNYDFSADSHWALGDFSSEPETRTLVTGSKVKVPGQTDWNEMVTLYDDLFRMEATVSLDYQNNRDSLVNEYFSDVLPLVTQTTHIHVSALTNDTTTLVKDFDYDHADRLLSVSHQINDETAVVILENEYNELGELKTKKLNKEGASDYTQEVDYQYNIRGWLTKINDPITPDADDYFHMQLKYDDAGQYNGNIGATSWKNPFETATNSYDYTYDAVNRLKSAAHNDVLSAGYSVSNIDYDANGNILALARYGDHDDQANQKFDDLDYDYVGNQLTKVTDASGFDTGFKDGANATKEYVYDANGNMIKDLNKGIDSIAYNHLNLPIRVEMNTDGSNRIEYIYDAAGVKMAQLVYGADTLTKRTDYQGAFIYEDSVLQFIQHEEGRVIPVIASGSEAISSYDYQYHLKDHLGNVRATFKTAIDTDTYEATLETENDATESLYFQNLSTRATNGSANHTLSGDEAAALSSSALVGPAISLRVIPGDTIDMEVFAYYEGGTGYNNQVTLASFVSSLASTFGGTSGAGGESGAIFDGVNDAVTAGAGGVGGSGNDAVPAAYLSYILFDDNYNEIQNGYQEISSSASFNHERLFLDDLTFDQAGYLYIYTSMQSDVTSPIYFDDLKVTHTHSPIVSKDDYYPFGLTFGSYNRPASTGQNFKYNSFEYQQDLGLNLYDYQARQYDPVLGRFTSVDPLADLMRRHSPYNYAFDNPIRYIDPDGMGPEDEVEQEKEIEQDTEESEEKKDDNVDFHFMGSPVDFSETNAGQDIDAFLSGDFVKVDKEKPTEKATTDVDGISVTKQGDQPDNAPNTTGKVSIQDETVAADNVPPNELSRTQQLLGSVLSWVTGFNEVKPTGDSTVTYFYRDDKPTVRANLSSGGVGSGGRVIKNKADSASTKHKWSETAQKRWKGF